MQDKNKMHPQDLRNLFIFFGLSVAVYFVYDSWILQPQKEQIRHAQAYQEQQIQAIAEGGVPESLQIRPRDEVIEEAQRLTFDNGRIFGSMSLIGGRFDDVGLHEYFDTLEKKNEVRIFSPQGTDQPRYADYGWISSDDTLKLPDQKSNWRVVGHGKLTQDTPVTLVWNNGEGLEFKRDISIDEYYVFHVKQSVSNTSGRDVTLYPYALISQTGLPKDLQGAFIQHEGPIGYINEELVELSYKDLKKQKQVSKNSSEGWIGITDKYWLSAAFPEQGRDVRYRFNYVPQPKLPGSDQDRSRYQIDMMGAPVVMKTGSQASYDSSLYVGAKEVLVLQDYQNEFDVPNFDLAVDFGMFWFMTKPFFYILHFFGELFGNFGLAILMLTLIIRTAVFPLTNFSYVSFAKMKKIGPQMAEIKERCAGNREQLQKEVMELYSSEGVNPMSGCLPILLQIPIFFALYKVLFVTIEMRHAPFFGWITDLSAPDPTSLFNLFGLLPYGVPGLLQIGVWPCAMLVIMIIQKQLNPPPQDPLQRDMMKFFPFIITFVLAGFASGLVIYWTFSAFLSMLQQMVIMRRLGVPIHLFGETEEEEVQAVESPKEAVKEEEIDDKPAKPVSKPKPKKSKKSKKSTSSSSKKKKK